MKNFKRILILLLAICTVFCFLACEEQKTPCTEHTDANQDGICDVCEEQITVTPPAEEGLELIKDGEFTFQIVRGNDLPLDLTIFLDDMSEMVSEFGVELPVVDDRAEETEIEVLIGTVTTRGEEYCYDKYSLGKDGYAIIAIDNKVIVTGGSEKTLTKAVEEFFEDILELTLDAETYPLNAVLNESNSVLEVQDDYRIKSVTIGGQDIKGYRIAIDSSVKGDFAIVLKAGAEQLREFFYTKVGYYLEIVDITNLKDGEDAIIFRGTEKGGAGTKGFQVRVDGKSLYIECAHYNMFADAFEPYFNKNFGFANKEELKLTNYTSEVDITIVFYGDERFGAVGDGKTNDYAAIKAAHDFANDGGQTVYANAGKTYLIEDAPAMIKIQTDVNWNNATIIIDDSRCTTSKSPYWNNIPGGTINADNVFNIVSDKNNSQASKDQLAEVNALKGDGEYVLIGLEGKRANGLEPTTNIGFAPGFKAMLTIYNANTLNYIRYGYSNADGSSQNEIIVVDANGNIDPDTPLLHDYTSVTSITIHPLDVTPITIQNATVISKASRVNLHGGYHSISRGISVGRPNTTLYNLIHVIEGEIAKNAPVKVDENGLSYSVESEGYKYNSSTGMILEPNGKVYSGTEITTFTGHSYGGFVSVSSTSDVYVTKCVFQARVVYKEGTYDIGAARANNLIFTDCTQSNFFEEGTIIPNMSKCWGVAGTNYCKNLDYINCELTRYDAHSGVTNGEIIGGKLAVLRLIGGGTFKIEGVEIYNRSGTPFQIREDYGASFNGDLIIKDCHIIDAFGTNTSTTALISLPATYWDMGYKCFAPNIEIDNLEIDTVYKEIPIFAISDPTKASSNTTYDHSHQFPFRDALRYDPSDPDVVITKKNQKGYIFHYNVGPRKGVDFKLEDGTTEKRDLTTAESLEYWLDIHVRSEDGKFYGITEDNYTVDWLDDGTCNLLISDTKNRFVYYAPEYIKVVNMENKSFKLVLFMAQFFSDEEKTKIEATTDNLKKMSVPKGAFELKK